MANAATHRTVEAVWRIESARLIAGLARTVRDVGLAEDLAQDALVAALEQWPSTGVPGNPGAWLNAVARRRYIDGVRRQVSFERKVAEIGRELAEAENPMDEIEFDDHVEDDVLRLIFTACHPALSRDARVALTLKLVGGLSTEQIARAFLVPAPTMAARITRAKKALADAKVPFEVPAGAGLAARLASVLEVVYLIFNEGYAATSGDSWTRAELCEEAMRLGRMLAALAPNEPDVHALVALMEIQASRIPARTGRDGELITLLDQDRSRWNRLLITHGLAALAAAESLSGSEFSGPYVIQAALAACHARALVAADTDWIRIATLWRPCVARAVAGDRAQPRRRRVDGRRARRRAGDRGRAGRRTRVARLSPAAERARGSARAARQARRGTRRIPARGGDDRQHRRARPPARPRRRLRLTPRWRRR